MASTDDQYVKNIFNLLSPRGIPETSKNADGSKSIETQVRELLVDNHHAFSYIQEKLDEFYTKSSASQSNSPDKNLELIASRLHAICNNPDATKAWIVNKSGKYEDSIYWGKKQFSEIFHKLKDFKCNIAIISTSDPFITPADANTDDVEMFLNYMPNHIASSLIPYLEVDFRMEKFVPVGADSGSETRYKNYLNTPSTLRFLLGSIDAGDGKVFRSSDAALNRISTDPQVQGQAAGSSPPRIPPVSRAQAGMDLFFAPQTLTNMDALGPSPTRLVRAKPFTPFASIVDFDVQYSNAGSGAMVTKQAKLQMIIHDKSRISEISEFIRGPSGFGSAQVWVSFGWLCPRNPYNSDEDTYSKFINDKMHLEECFQVKNTSFSFDQSGKVNLTLELVGFGSSTTKKASIMLADEYHNKLKQFQAVMEEIAKSGRDILESPLGPDARIVQLVNLGASGRLLPTDIENPSALISNVVQQHADASGMSEQDKEKLMKTLLAVLDPRPEAGRGELAVARVNSIVQLITRDAAPAQSLDPFLPPYDGSDSERLDYFNPDLAEEVRLFKTASRPLPAGEKDGKAKKQDDSKKKGDDKSKDEKKNEFPRLEIKLGEPKPVVSFGKLFCNIILPAMINANFLDFQGVEVQVIFYALNDECGPVGGSSIAEFPIDLERFVYALDDAINARMKSDVTIEEFFRTIINNQFNDDRSIGFGMVNKWLFEPFNKDKPAPEAAQKTEEYESNLAKWQAQNPSFARPMIEMSMETNVEKTNTASRIHSLFDKHESPPQKGSIVRIHIYDKQHNPRKLFSQVAALGGDLTMGMFNLDGLRQEIKQAASQSQGAKGKKPPAAGSTQSLEALDKKLSGIIASLQAARGNSSNLKAAENNALSNDLTGKVYFKNAAGQDAPLQTIKGDLFGREGIRENMKKMVPSIVVGTEGSMLKSVSLASKTDDLIAASNLVNIMKPKPGVNNNMITPMETGLASPGGLPLRTVPASLSITTMGCPIARCYQQYFIDMGTGTSLDNLYTSTQIAHKISQGKFETAINFTFSDGYGKFGAPPTLQALLKQQQAVIKRHLGDAAKTTTPANKPASQQPKTASPPPVKLDDALK